MARMYPDRILDENTPQSERKVFDALKGLNDEWMVFHSVAWQGLRGRRQNDGEADFIVAHPEMGALVVEVKGGGITMLNGQWISTDRGGRRHNINPFAQVRDSKHNLGRYLAEHIPRAGNKVHMGHAVVFPDVEIASDLSAEAQREVILDRYDLKSIQGAITRVAGHWGDSTRFDTEQFSALQRALAPSRHIRRLLCHEVEERVEELIELTDQQLLALGFLRRQRRALITGGAGTGKTVLAMERARQLAADGLEVLLLCFNAPLGDKLSEELAGVANITVGNFHKIARRIVADANLLPSDTSGQEFWSETLPNILPLAAYGPRLSFDAIVIDEGQDFYANWWKALQFLLSDSDDSFFYVFADANQNIYRSDWEPPFEGEPFELDINCRNTVPIAERVGAVFDRDEPSLGTDGPAPAFIELAAPTQAPKKLATILTKLIRDEGMRPDQITVLANEKKLIDGLRGQQIEGHKLVAAGGKGITVETVHRFKGLESDAVVLVLTEMNDRADRVLAYVGMSRARVVLFVLGTSEVKEALNWP